MQRFDATLHRSPRLLLLSSPLLKVRRNYISENYEVRSPIHLARFRAGTRRTLWISALLLCGFIGMIPSPARAQETTPQEEITFHADPQATPLTQIKPGCTLGVTVTDEKDLSSEYTVDAEGLIHFRLTDDEGGNETTWTVSVAGKTVDEARAAITESLKKYLHTPEVLVVITKLQHLTVEIVGPARVTGKLELAPKARLSDAMAACKYRPNADIANIRILRTEKGDGNTPVKPRTIAVNFTAFMSGESDDDPPLETGDKIILPLLPEKPVTPELKFARIIGEVGQEANIPISSGLTMKDAFTRARGIKETADKAHIRLVRGADGKILELDGDRILANDPLHNVPLGAGDLIIVGVRDRSMRFAVLGEVLGQGTFDWNPKEKMTLLRAMEQAGGPTKKADHHKGFLRKGFLNNPSQSRDLPFDLDKVAQGKQPDWDVEAGDAILLLPKQHRPSFWEQLVPLALHFLPF